MNDSVPGSAYFSYENLGGGAHCCWNSMYDPNATNWTSVGTLGPNNAPSEVGTNQMGDYKAPSSIFQWMLQHGDTSLVLAGPVTPGAPVANAGSNQTIALPTTSVTLTGSGSETNGTITSYAWTQTAGPSTATITTPGQAQTTVTALAQGTYTFQLTVTDALGITATSSVQVIVNAAPVPGSPVANAGSGQTITLPTSSATLTGSGSETNGTIASYAWSQTAGPSTASITTPSAAQTTVTGLAQGTYTFQLTVTDALGVTATASVQITVNAAPTGPTVPSNVIKQVVVAEYRTWYITGDGKIWAYNNNSLLPVQCPIGGLKADTAAGGFNYFRAIDEQGYVWTSQVTPSLITTRYDTDTTGAPFNGNWYIDAYGHAGVTIRSDSSVWLFGMDILSLFYPGGYPFVPMAGANIKPTQLSPAGMKFKKVLFGGASILGLTTSGKVYQWSSGGSRTPTLIALPGAASDIFISHLSVLGAIVPDPGETSGMGYPYIWGNASSMWGGVNSATPVSVRSLWKMTAPIKEISVDWNTIHYIDSLGNMYGSGFNSSGEVGNGQEFVGKYNYPGWPNYGWSFTDYENPTGIPVQIGKGVKWKHLYSNNWFGFYKYAMDENDSIYSWGRNKSLALGNGLWNGYDGGAYHANTLDVLKPTMVHPLTSIFTEYDYEPPTITMDPKQIISTSTATLTGKAKPLICVSVKKPAPNGLDTVGYKIVSYLWTKVSGPAGGTIASPNAATTSVSGLTTGTYIFNVLATDNNTGTISGNDTIVVTAVVPGPITVSAGANQTITLPTNSVTLTGTASEVNGTIKSYAWSQISGPSTATITTAGQAQTTVTGLVQGVYRFQLLVTDALGTTATATVQVTVNPAPVVPGPPSANAGSDQTITLPTNSATLTGSGTETNGTIVSYAWTQISGPSTATITSAGSAQTTVTGLVQGVYVFQLLVTDNSGVTATDQTQVTVNPTVPVPGTPVANAGSDQTITLPTNSVSLSGSGTETNGTIVGYAWTQVSGPSTATITTPGQAQTTVTGLVQGIYRFKLTVTDNSGVTATATMQVTVNPAAVVAGPPSANAGSDQTITLPTNSVTLNGSGSESNGTIVSYAWVKTSGPAPGAITSAGQAQTTVTGLVQGVYTFQLTVTDALGVTATDVITVTVDPDPTPANQSPVAVPGSNQTTTATAVNLDGSGSYDPDGTIASYKWQQTSGANGVTITGSTTAKPTIAGLAVGVYTFMLTVTDNAGATGSASVTITVTMNSSLTAVAGNDTTVYYPNANNAVLNGTASYDPVGTITGYAWSQVSGPTNVAIATGNTSIGSVTGLAIGDYVFQLTVTSNSGATSSATVTVHVKDNERTTATSKLYPNPIPMDQQLVIEGSNSYMGKVTFVLRDIQGRIVRTVTIDKQDPNYALTMNMGGLGRGTYVLFAQFFLDEKPMVQKVIID